MSAYKWTLQSFIQRYVKWPAEKQYRQREKSFLRSLSDKQTLPVTVAGRMALAAHARVPQDVVAVLRRRSESLEAWGRILAYARKRALEFYAHTAYVDMKRKECRKNKAASFAHYQFTFTDLNEGCLAWATSVASRDFGFARFWGDRIGKEFRTKGPLMNQEDIRDDDFYDLIPFELATFFFHGLWRKKPFLHSGPQPKSWKVFDAVLDGWDDERRFARAVTGLCEYHCQNCMERRVGLNIPFMSCPYSVFPAEILALKVIRASLKLPFPEIDHPLLVGNPMAEIPDGVIAAPPDELEALAIKHIQQAIPGFVYPIP